MVFPHPTPLPGPRPPAPLHSISLQVVSAYVRDSAPQGPGPIILSFVSYGIEDWAWHWCGVREGTNGAGHLQRKSVPRCGCRSPGTLASSPMPPSWKLQDPQALHPGSAPWISPRGCLLPALGRGGQSLGLASSPPKQVVSRCPEPAATPGFAHQQLVADLSRPFSHHPGVWKPTRARHLRSWARGHTDVMPTVLPTHRQPSASAHTFTLECTPHPSNSGSPPRTRKLPTRACTHECTHPAPGLPCPHTHSQAAPCSHPFQTSVHTVGHTSRAPPCSRTPRPLTIRTLSHTEFTPPCAAICWAPFAHTLEHTVALACAHASCPAHAPSCTRPFVWHSHAHMYTLPVCSFTPVCTLIHTPALHAVTHHP